MAYRLSDLTFGSLPPLLPDGAGAPAGDEGARGEETGAAPAMQRWFARRREIAAVWADYLGYMPAPVDPDVRIGSRTRERDHVRIHLSYATGYGDRVTAYLLVPGDDERPQGRLPAVLALHPTHVAGKADVASPEARANRAYGLELVARGYVVLAPDTMTAGERIGPGEEPFRTASFYRRFPLSTAFGKMLHDHQQGLDVLAGLPFVDAERIGAIGHSLGAYNAFVLAGWDRRVRAVVSSCGLSPFAGDPEPNRWGLRDWFSHLPRITDDLRRGEVPFEFHEIAALCAPTPMFQWAGLNDDIFPHWPNVAEALLEIGKLYDKLGFGDRYVGLMGAAGHDFPREIRLAAYRFLDRWLRSDGAPADA
jgi:dienelactone hydrolase